MSQRECTQRQLDKMKDHRQKLQLHLACVNGIIKDLEDTLWLMEQVEK